MNLLEQYIIQVISEEQILHDGKLYCRVVAIIDCYGQVEQINKLFSLDEWNEAKRKGYYMA